jgi:propanediol dehydratase large subunit
VEEVQVLAGNGRDKRLSARQEKALATLLTTSSVPEAAAKAGCSERSLRRWLAEDVAFISEYRERRRRVVEEAEGVLQGAMTDAANVLRDLLKSENEHVRYKAAISILEDGFATADNDLLERIEALEAASLREGGVSGET